MAAMDMDSSMVEEASSVGEDYLLLDTPMSEETKPFEPTLVDMDVNVTKEDLDAQLTELRGIMSRMGLDSKSVDPEGAGQSGPPRGFVHASQPHHQDNVKTLKNELLNLALDKASGTCLIEGWETLLPPLPDSVARFARVVGHGELKALLSEFRTSSWSAPLVARILEVYVIAKRSAAPTHACRCWR